MDVEITVRCIGCKAIKTVDRAEAERLSATQFVPMCDQCFMPMVAEKIRSR